MLACKGEAFAGIFTKFFNRNGGLPWQSARNDSCGQNVNFVMFQCYKKIKISSIVKFYKNSYVLKKRGTVELRKANRMALQRKIKITTRSAYLKRRRNVNIVLCLHVSID